MNMANVGAIRPVKIFVTDIATGRPRSAFHGTHAPAKSAPLPLQRLAGEIRISDRRRTGLKSSASRNVKLTCRAASGAAEAEDQYSDLQQVVAVLGSQWGDEGKGKLVDIIAQKYDVICRCQGGANAGHTIYDETGKKYALHQVPSGILNRKSTCLIGHGTVVHLPSLFEEIEKLEASGVSCEGRLLLSDRAHLLFDLHREADGLREEELAGNKIGTTKRGIGPAYASKANRVGVRVNELRKPDLLRERLEVLFDDTKKRFPSFEGDLDAELERYAELAARVDPFICDTVEYVNKAFKEGKLILVEGANATMLDIDFGTYPFVTSSNPSIGGVVAGLGLAPNKFGDLIGVAKAYTTRVGAGPYPTELFGDLAEDIRSVGFEYGTTTGRPRRCGWLDIVALNYATQINGYTCLNLTKLDCLDALDEVEIGVGYKDPDGNVINYFPADVDYLSSLEAVYETMPGWKEDISKIRTYDELPANAKTYISRVEELTGLPCKYIGVGPGRDAMIVQQ
ncbi:hypothetical protein CYMTET_6263 [Cymbomonas tetramitiformis]|uniref:Adenylosuccinate synthetase, chloroplastic n=1 Tax=Cymbomonas tetramitiformis TaxID=36881 RepID=A0AAE0GXU9_9CHLO|nr:hypothetical protein CYMTET_6263 [Cymbomonas tetramitiformis]